jgi:hypothetical protein
LSTLMMKKDKQLYKTLLPRTRLMNKPSRSRTLPTSKPSKHQMKTEKLTLKPTTVTPRQILTMSMSLLNRELYPIQTWSL